MKERNPNNWIVPGSINTACTSALMRPEMLEEYLSWSHSDGVRWRATTARRLPRKPRRPRKDSYWYALDELYEMGPVIPPDTPVLYGRRWIALFFDGERIIALAPCVETLPKEEAVRP